MTALAALVLGWWQVSSVPNETGPSALLYLLPGAALLLSSVGLLVWGERLARLGFVAAVPLAVWGFLKLDGPPPLSPAEAQGSIEARTRNGAPNTRLDLARTANAASAPAATALRAEPRPNPGPSQTAIAPIASARPRVSLRSLDSRNTVKP